MLKKKRGENSLRYDCGLLYYTEYVYRIPTYLFPQLFLLLQNKLSLPRSGCHEFPSALLLIGVFRNFMNILKLF